MNDEWNTEPIKFGDDKDWVRKMRFYPGTPTAQPQSVIFHNDAADIVLLAPGLLLVGVHANSQSDVDYTADYLKQTFGENIKALVVRGGLTAETLTDNHDLRKAIKDIVREVLSEKAG